MSFWRQFTRGFRVLTRRNTADQDLSEEIAHYFEQAIGEKVSAGMTPEAARRATQLEFGSATLARETVRSQGWESFVSGFFLDIRYAARQLRSHIGFTAVSVLTLAVGIGATTAIFSAIDPILIEPLPYPNASKILTIWYAGDDGSRVPQTFHNYRELAERAPSLAYAAVARPWMPSLNGSTHPERLEGQQVSADYFRTLGVSPIIGRDFTPSDDIVHGPRVAILSNGLWKRSFGAAPAIMGQTVRLGDENYTVIGVMPPSFENVLAPSAELWSPLQYDASNIASTETREWGHHLRMIGRLRPGSTIEHARREFDFIAHKSVPEFARPAWASMQKGVLCSSLQDDVTRNVRPALLAVLGAVTLLLLIACVNVTNLLLARGAQRSGEFAMRAALGADRFRLWRQLLTESLLLAGLGGAAGIVLAMILIRSLVVLSPPEIPRLNAIALNRPALVFSLVITALVGLVVGFVPAIFASRRNLNVSLLASSRRVSSGHHWTRRTLVVAEVALALVLLVGAGLLLHSMRRLFAVDAGFDPTRLITMQVELFGRNYQDPKACQRFFDLALNQVRALPEVAAAGFTSQLPLSGDPEDGYGVHLESDDVTGIQSDRGALRYAVSPGFLEAMKISVVRGRSLNERDTAESPPAALISDSLARSRFPGVDPIGQRIRIGPKESPWFTIVGIVNDVKQTSLALRDDDAVYILSKQWTAFADRARWLIVRSRGDAADMVPGIKNAIWAVDQDQPIVRVSTMTSLVAASEAERRFTLALFEAFAVAALLLAAIGIYGVLSGGVNERIREIGVRAALGASPQAIRGLILRQGMAVTTLGVGLGLIGSVIASRGLAALLFGVSWLDPVTYLGVVVLLMTVAVIACWMPAWRAAKVDPSIALQAE